METKYTCIVCPRSCDLVVFEQDGEWEVKGNSCPRGAEYGLNEHTHPKRMITTTVKMAHAKDNHRLLPVISSDFVPKEKLKDCLSYLYGLEIEAPVKLHDKIVENILDTGVDILAARDMERME